MADKQKRLYSPQAILSYPHIFKARAMDEDKKPEYSCCLIFTVGTDLTELKNVALAVARERWGANADDMIRAGKVVLPFRRDWEAKSYPEGSEYINVRAGEDYPPGVVSRYKDPATGKARVITDPKELYPGCVVRASLRVYAWEYKNMKKGVSFGLGNIQKLEDGERLDSSTSATDEFEADLTEEPADLDDLIAGV